MEEVILPPIVQEKIVSRPRCINYDRPLSSLFQDVGPLSVYGSSVNVHSRPEGWRFFAVILRVRGPHVVGLTIDRLRFFDEEFARLSFMHTICPGFPFPFLFTKPSKNILLGLFPLLRQVPAKRASLFSGSFRKNSESNPLSP